MSGSGSQQFAAVDLGATSGRVILGRVGPGELALRQVARFPNEPVPLRDGLHWNLLGLYRSVLDGLALAVREAPGLASVGIDSWAVDYALLRDGRMLSAPFHYRDERRGAAGPRALHERFDHAALYARNGLQFLPFNTVYQLAAEPADALAGADALLLIPDLLAFELTGRLVAERTNASTTGLLGARTREWDDVIAHDLRVDHLLPELVGPGTVLGPIGGPALEVVGAPVPVVAVGSHDTASAVVALPATRDDVAYVSCGTWGLVGVELEEPVLTDAAREASFTNEGGVDGRVRFLHNVMGLWLLSECVRAWGSGESLEGLLAAAAEVPASVPVFDVDDPRFLAPGEMPERIAAWFSEHGMPVPASRAELVRSIIESLAQAFAETVRTAAALSGKAVSVIHLVGGGAQNRLLCQATADRAGLPIIAGPVEATAIGNLLVQARAAGALSGSLESLRALVAATQRPETYTPSSSRSVGARS